MRSLTRKLKKLFTLLYLSDSSYLSTIGRFLYYRILGKNILCHQSTIIKGVENISTNGLLNIGVNYVGFVHKHDVTLLNVTGRLVFDGSYLISKGCRFDIGLGAVATFGTGYVNANTLFIISHSLTIGKNCSISWGCQFLDNNFHKLVYAGMKRKLNGIVLGDNVWIGSNVTILQGARIPNGCVVASGSTVNGVFDKENCLIAGSPASIVKEDVHWS